MAIKFEFLEHGDCTLISTDDFSMMIDGGNTDPFDPFDFNGPPPLIDTIIVTHIDKDHIGGIIGCLKREALVKNLKYVVFNEPKNSALFRKITKSKNITTGHGNLLGTIIEFNTNIYPINHVFTTLSENTNLNEYAPKGQTITGKTQFFVLSPSKSQLDKLYDTWRPEFYKESKNVSSKAMTQGAIELLGNTDEFDTAMPNGSSLAFLVCHNSHKFLILGDAHIKQITAKLVSMGYKNADGHRLQLEFVKLSHHGSKRSTSREFLGLVETTNYVITKSLPTPSKNPDRETIAKIVRFGHSKGKTKNIFINNLKPSDLGFTDEERSNYKFTIKSTREFKSRY